MSAPTGNRFWEQRSRHGREKLFATPELMWEAACEYFVWCEENPLIAIEYNGKDAVKCEVPKMRPFTMQGLTSFLGCNTGYFRDFKAGIADILNDKEAVEESDTAQDFSFVITRIEETVYNQKFTGAASGFLNANIISRDLGLSDKKELEGNVNVTQITGMTVA